jgi:hypothetical protein
MKKLSILFALCSFLLSSTLAFSQKAKVTKDAFTGEQVVTAVNAFVAYEVKNKTTTLVIPFTYGGQLTNVIPQGTEVLFKMKNGDVIKLLTKIDAQPSTKIYASQYSAGINTTYNYTFDIDKVTIDKLSKLTMELARFPNFPSGTVDIQGKMAKKLAKSILTGAKNIIIYT